MTVLPRTGLQIVQDKCVKWPFWAASLWRNRKLDQELHRSTRISRSAADGFSHNGISYGSGTAALATPARSTQPARLRCSLNIARYTGRRIDAICNLQVSDLLLSRDRLAAVLAATGRDESHAAYNAHGASRWRPETDKQGLR